MPPPRDEPSEEEADLENRRRFEAIHRQREEESRAREVEFGWGVASSSSGARPTVDRRPVSPTRDEGPEEYNPPYRQEEEDYEPFDQEDFRRSILEDQRS